jgi:hypothetical protein
MLYAEQMLDAIDECAMPGQPLSLEACLASAGVQQQLDAVRAQWGIQTAGPCATTDVHSDLAYLQTCGAAPSECRFTPTTPVLDRPGESNDLLDCLACHIAEDLGNVGRILFADQSSTGRCHDALGQGGISVIRALLQQLDSCLAPPDAISIAACFEPDLAAWRAQAECACAGVDPFATIGYPNLCSGVEPTTPGWCADHALPCTFMSTSELSAAGFDNDLLDCLNCQIEEAALSVARQLHGANLCCIGSTCDTVLTRSACRRANGTPVHYWVDVLSSNEPIPAVHGLELGPDGSLYVGDHSGWIKKVDPDGTVSVIGATTGFVTGVAVDGAGNIYYTERCEHQVLKMTPSGQVSVLAGTGLPGHSGDGGPATAAEITAPDGITLDAAGNVYFTESGLLNIYCGGLPIASERVRVVDTSGTINTIAGSTAGTTGAGGPATEARLTIPYSLRRSYDGSLLIGENGPMRVLRIDAGGILSHVAGRVQAPVAAHSGYGGPALAARFYHTCGLASDPDGNVIVGAMEDNRLALVDRLGSVIGIAGTGEGSTPSSGLPRPALLAAGFCCEDVSVNADGLIYCSDLLRYQILVLWREPF